jgi:glucose-1-phosphate thymidylyltransferase
MAYHAGLLRPSSRLPHRHFSAPETFRARVRVHTIRLVSVLGKGVVVVPNTARWTGPWLGATRRPSLQRIANRPIICHVLDALLEAGVVEVAVVAPPEATEEISTCVSSEGPDGVAVRHIVNDSLAGNDDALLAAAEFVGDAPCILHRANGLLGAPLLPYVETLETEAVDVLLLVEDGGRDVKRLRLVSQPARGDREPDPASTTVGFAGICVLGAGLLARLPNPERSAQLHDFAALAEQLSREGGRTQVRVARGWQQFAGDALDLLDMNRTMLNGLSSEMTASAYDGNRFEGPIAIHPTACVTSSVIIGPVMIGADALIADSYIGPHTSIGERVRIEGAELERSIVLADASVLHVGGRLVASVVGRHARVFRDFSMPRALRLQVGDGDEVALC